MAGERLTAAIRKAVQHVAQNDGTSFFPIGLCAMRTVRRAAGAGYIEARLPAGGFGLVRYFLTPAGRRALEEADHG